ncbi:exodeoxyribonuclease VII small subunit, partial [Dysosmobacter welbionis]
RRRRGGVLPGGGRLLDRGQGPLGRLGRGPVAVDAAAAPGAAGAGGGAAPAVLVPVAAEGAVVLHTAETGLRLALPAHVLL